MVVAGDHANNDMAGEEEDSWKSVFEASKAFDSVDTQIAGLGSVKEIQDIYVAHAGEAIAQEDTKKTEETSNTSNDTVLEDGTYIVEFNTDSSMFHVNDAKDGKGELTVKDGVMTLHISLTSKNITNLFLGLAKDAKKDGADILEPTLDTVTYSDGTTEEVNGFDVTVPYLDDEFDLALIGKKNKWYDHKVSVTNPVKAE